MRPRLLVASLLLTGVACGGIDSDVTVATWLQPPLDAALVTVHLRDDAGTWTVRGADFRSTPDLGMPHSPSHETHWSGQLHVTFQLADTNGAAAVSDSLSLDLRPDWALRIDFINATLDPMGGCFGCMGSRSYPLPAHLRGPGRDSLWVVWGGNSKSHPVTY